MQLDAHCPCEQTSVAAQAAPQPPQWLASEATSTQTLPHEVRPGWQAQTPASQSCPGWQPLPQAPQLNGSDWVFTQSLPQLS